MQIGSQIYTLRDDIKTVEGVKKVFDFLQTAKSDAVELAVMPKIPAIDLYKISQKSGVKIVSSHNSLKSIKKDIYKLIADHLIYQAKYIGIGGMPPHYLTSEKRIKKFAEIMNEAAEIAQQYGLSMIYHNHAFEFEITKKDKTVFDILLESFSENVKICLDCYWAYTAKQDVTMLINKIGARLAIIHCKDLPEGGSIDGFKMVAPGRGTLNYKEYLDASKNAGCEYALVELDESKNPKEEMIFGINHLKQIIK